MSSLRISRALWLLAVCSGVVAQTTTTTTTGDTYCNNQLCVAATVNGSSVQYVLQSTGSSKLGWMAMGFGTQMANTPMVIMWPNSDGSITLSQRKAPSEVMPTVDSSPPRVASISADLSSTSGSKPQLAFTIPANSDTKQNIIWAFGTQSPGSSAVDATLQQHLVSGTASLDLTKTSGSGSSTPSSSGSSSIPLLPYQKLIVAHGILCAVGFVFLLPMGALIARYLRTFTPVWFRGHAFVQFGLAGPVIITGVALGIRSVTQAGATHFNDDHKKLGIALFVLYFVQCSVGAFIHYIKPKTPRGRPPQNYMHAVIGLVIFGVALYQVRLGYRTEWPTTTGREALPRAVDIVWYVVVVMIPVLYALGLAFLPRQFKQEKARLSMQNTYGLHPRYRDEPEAAPLKS